MCQQEKPSGTDVCQPELPMNKFAGILNLPLALGLLLLGGCDSSSGLDAPAPLSKQNINLVFVLSPDLTDSAPGDVNQTTANLTNQGLNRSLMMASYLRERVLGKQNVTGIYSVAPMTHLQTANNLPDMAAMGAIQQFAMLNQFTQPLLGSAITATGVNSFPLNVSYAASAALPSGVVTPYFGCPSCQGLDFANSGGANDALLAGLVNAKASGFHVFSAPWVTTSAMLTRLNQLLGASLNLPSAYAGPNRVYAVSITPTDSASLTTFDAPLSPAASAPVLPAALAQTACTAQPHKFSISLTVGQPYSQTLDGVTRTGNVPAVLPAGINTQQTVYMIRHAEAHPSSSFENGNFVAPGQWRALGLADALRGKIKPDLVVSIDPAQVIPSGGSLASPYRYSYVRTTMTAEPYAIANNLPFYLVSDFSLMDINFTNLQASASVIKANDYFFTDGAYAGKKVLMAWEHAHFPPTLNELLKRYFPNGGQPSIASNFWPEADYDTVWTVTLDAQGNLTADNALCEGIDTTTLPLAAPQF
jgi:hypothetical protein